MLKIRLLAIAFFLCGIASAQIYTPPNPTEYGHLSNREKALLVQHIPEKTDLLTNTNDTTAQIFFYKPDSSLWLYAKSTGFVKLGHSGGSTIIDTGTRTINVQGPLLYAPDDSTIGHRQVAFDSLARLSISLTGSSGLTYDNSTGVFNYTGGVGSGGVDSDADSLGGLPANRYMKYIDTAAALLPYGTAINKNKDSLAAHNIRIGLNTTAIATKLNISDTTNKWVQFSYLNATGDSLITVKNGTRTAQKITVVGGAGPQDYNIKDTSNAVAVFNVMKFNALGNGSHDDGPAIQATINAIMRDTIHCYGIVYFPFTGKEYIVGNRSVINASNGKSVNNAQIYIPDLTPDPSRTKPCGIKFLGQVAPNFQTGAAQINYAFPESSKGVVLRSTDSLDLTACVIGSAYTAYPYTGTNFNFTKFEMENIGIMVKSTRAGVDTAATMLGVDAYNLTQFGMANCFVRTETNHITAGTPVPASSSIGIRMPHINNWGVAYLNEVWVQGFYTDIYSTEHFSSSNYLFVGASINGLETGGGQHASVIQKLLVQGNKYNIKLNDLSYIDIGLLDIEDDITGGYWWSNVYDVYQPTVSTRVNGHLNYHRLNVSIGGEDNVNFTRSPNVSAKFVTDTMYKRSLNIGGDALGQPYVIGSLDNNDVKIKSFTVDRIILKSGGFINMGANPATFTSPAETVNVDGSLFANTYITSPKVRVGYSGQIISCLLQVRSLSAIDLALFQQSTGVTALYISKNSNLNIGATTDASTSNILTFSTTTQPAAIANSGQFWAQFQTGTGDYGMMGSTALGRVNYVTGDKIGLKSSLPLRLVSADTTVMTLTPTSNVLVGTNTELASSKLTVQSTTQGVLVPRMTKAQRDAISSPAEGLMIYQTDNTPGFRVRNGSNWMKFTETID